MPDELLDGAEAGVWRVQERLSHRLADVSQMDRLNSTGGIAILFAPIRRGSVDLAFSGSQSKSLSVWFTRSKYEFVGTPKLKSEIYSIRFVTNGIMVRKNRQGIEFIGRPGLATLLAFDDMAEDRASADFAALTATVTRKAILLACEALDGIKPLALPDFVPVIATNLPGILALRQTLYMLHSRLQQGVEEFDLISSLMEETLVYQLITAWPKLDSTRGYPEPTLHISIRVAVDYIEANLSKKITIAEIAEISEMGVRSLQAAFRQKLGCTPVQFIINRRLEQVHDILQYSDGSLTIRQIAMQWGFTHMSDFSRRYRQRYGCAPKMSRGIR